MKIANLRCACGSDDVIAVSPGQEGTQFGDLFAVTREIPDRAWCPAHWPVLAHERAAS